MKKVYLYILILLTICVSCDRDSDVTVASLTIKSENITTSYTSITLQCSFESNAKIAAICVEYATSQDFSEYQSITMYKDQSDMFSATIYDLQANTTYFIRYRVSNAVSYIISDDVHTAVTLPSTLPQVITGTVSNITNSSASLSGIVQDDTGAEVSERGVCYSISSNPSITDNKLISGSGIGDFLVNISQLQEATTYYARTYAVNKNGVGYGKQVSFTTLVFGQPKVNTIAISNVTRTSATVEGNVVEEGEAEVSERGVCYSTSLSPTVSDNKITAGNGGGTFSVELNNLSEGTTYYVCAYAINAKGISYGTQLQFTTEKTPIENGHEYVDLGLSVKWATCNVGASKPEEYGDYFAWGEVMPKEEGYPYDWNTYKYCNGSASGINKYYYNGVSDYIELEISDDAAYVNWGGKWRMPTQKEMQELRDNCSFIWMYEEGVYGVKVTSKKNNKSIFLPAAGYCYNTSKSGMESYCYYWSSSIYYSYNGDDEAYFMWISEDSSPSMMEKYRYYGMPIRPVCP